MTLATGHRSSLAALSVLVALASAVVALPARPAAAARHLAGARIRPRRLACGVPDRLGVGSYLARRNL